jgi:hypothetical protein
MDEEDFCLATMLKIIEFLNIIRTISNSVEHDLDLMKIINFITQKKDL